MGYSEYTVNLKIRDLENFSIEDLIEEISQDHMQRAVNSFPLMSKSKEFKNYKTNLNNFWNLFLTKYILYNIIILFRKF